MKRETSNFSGKQNVLNMISQAVSFIVNMLIGFFLTPYIVEKLGSTAYGFVGLASNFVTYASLITTALNSMAGRFIAVSFYREDYENVRKYYSSVFIADVLICLILSLPSIFILSFLPRIIDIPNGMEMEVTTLFVLTFVEFLISLLTGAFGSSAYVKNRIDLVAARNVESKLIRIGLLLVFFGFFAPHLWYIGLIGCVCTLYATIRTYQIHHRVMPEVKINKSDFEFAKIKELVSSGIWNSVSSLGSMLNDSLDLLIANTLVGSAAMGIVSVAKVVPIYLSSILISIVSTFSPTLTKLYAEGNFCEIEIALKKNMKIMGGLLCIPLSMIVVFGKDFFSLWVPSQDAMQLWILAVITLSLYPISLSISPLGNIFTSANKVRVNSIVTICVSLVSIGVTFILLKNVENEMGKMIVIIAVSRIFTLLQDVFFAVPYIAKVIGRQKKSFYFSILRNIAVCMVTCGLLFVVKNLFFSNISSWIMLCIAGIVACVVGGLVILFILMDSVERKQVLSKLSSKKL